VQALVRQVDVEGLRQAVRRVRRRRWGRCLGGLRCIVDQGLRLLETICEFVSMFFVLLKK
jgi:hypothetical protein